MPGESRSLPGHPSLRHLKLEAKRRLAAGEFPTLHDAQVAIAREHGLPTWVALKQRVSDTPDSHALDQLRWIIARFADADRPGWITPSDDELNQHFDEHFLAALPPAALIKTISNMAADLRGDPVVLGQTPVQAYIQLQGMHYIAVAEPDPPHRLTGLRGLPVGSRVHDSRIAEPPVRTQGEVPATVATIAEQAFAELGLTALLLAGGDHQAAAGLWSTGADLVRLGLGWSSLLPEALAHEALTPQSGPGGTRIGLGWIIAPRGDIASHAGANLDATAAVTTRIQDQRTHVVLTSRMIPVNSIETRLLRAWTNP
jgi:hypothetical protein